MAPEHRVQTRRLVPAILAASALVLGAPYIGGIRAALRGAVTADQFVAIVVAAMAVAVALAIGLGLARIRERRVARYGAIAAALVIAVAYALATSSGSAEQDAVERFHFVEYGVVTLLFYRVWKEAGDLSVVLLPVLAGLLVGTLEEWFQWFVPVRVGEVKDVFTNLVAIGCGLLFALAIDPPPPVRAELRGTSSRVAGLLAGALVVVFAGFFHALHLGYAVHDGEIGTFVSRYSAGRLLELSAARAARWQTDPPLEWRRLSREDQYLSEGLVHVQQRNRMWEGGNVPAAWAENRILEKYFAPVLDTPSYVSRTGHRWPAAQREDADRRSASSRTLDYISRAYPYELYPWSRSYYWAVALGLAAACVLPAVVAGRSSTR